MQKINFPLHVLAFFLAFFVLHSIANAQVINNIYKTAILVPDSGEKTRSEAASKSLRQVLIRASGKAQALSSSNLDSYLDKAINYIEQYRYERTKTRIRLENGREVWAQKLYLTFSESGIKSILNKLNLDLWSKDRPKTIFWIFIRDESNSYVLSKNSNYGKHVTNTAWSRALPGYLPNFNSTDAEYISSKDIWQLDINVAKKAGRTYDAAVNVVARIYKSGHEYKGDWIVGSSFKNSSFSISQADLASVIKAGTNKVVEILANQYTNKRNTASRANRINLRIKDINNLKEYADLTNYFASNKYIASATTQQLDSEYIEFDISLKTNEDRFLKILKQDWHFKQLGANVFSWQ